MRLLIATLLLGASPAFADPTATPPKPAKGSPDEVICHREVNTGSLIQGKRTCMTRAQWQAQAEAAQAQGSQMDDRARITSCGSSTPGGC